MTDESGKKIQPKHWIINRTITKLADLGIVAALALLALAFQPLRERAAIIWNMPTAMAALGQELGAIRDTVANVSVDVRRLQLPDKVFAISDYNTRPLDGYCVEAEPCDIRIRLRRLEEALDCKIVPGTAIWGFQNPRSDTFVPAERLDRPNGRNIGTRLEDIQIRITTPRGLEPAADFIFATDYVGCPGMRPGDAPVTYWSERVSFEIRKGSAQ